MTEGRKLYHFKHSLAAKIVECQILLAPFCNAYNYTGPRAHRFTSIALTWMKAKNSLVILNHRFLLSINVLT